MSKKDSVLKAIKMYAIPAVLLVVLIACVLFFLFRAQEERRERAYLWLREGAFYQTLTLKGKLDGMYATLEAFAATLAARDLPKQEKLLGINAIRNACHFDFVLAIDSLGMGLNQTGKDNIDLSSRSYFLQSRRGTRSIGFVASGAVDKVNAFIGMAVPIMRDGLFHGVVYGSYNTKNFIEALNSRAYARDSFTQVVDRSGAVILKSKDFSHPALADKLRTCFIADAASARASHAVGTFEYAHENKNYYATYAPMNIEHCDWKIVNVIASEVVEQSEQTIFNYSLMLMVKIIIICALFLWYVAHRESLRLKLQTAVDSAEKANQAKGDFLSRVSHEIRTPMNAIVGMAGLALKTVNDPRKTTNYLSKINLASHILLHLINDVLDMASIENRKVKIASEPFDFSKLLFSICSLYSEQCRDKGIRFSCQLKGVQEGELVGDALRVNQILLNLLSNAVKFTPPGGKITLSVEQAETEKGMSLLHFAVSDTGCGMSEDMLDRLFTPFEQENSLTAQKFGGTGLGLSIVRNLVSLMGGSIEVTSRKNEGTRFLVGLYFASPASGSPDALAVRAVQKSEQEQGLRQEQKQEQEQEQEQGKDQVQISMQKPVLEPAQEPVLEPVLEQARCLGQRILLLAPPDEADEAHETARLVALLEKEGAICETARSETAAKNLLRTAEQQNEPYHLSLIDCGGLPLEEGLILAQKLKENFKESTGYLAVAAFDAGEGGRQPSEFEVDFLLPKPIWPGWPAAMLASLAGDQASAPDKDEGHAFSGARVLLAEDNPLNTEIAVELLQAVGLTVDCAENGRKALELLNTGRPYNLVLTDIQMPLMDGYELTRAIRSSERSEIASLPVIAMTAAAFDSDVAKAHDSGMTDHIAKPIDVQVLYHMLHSHLRS